MWNSAETAGGKSQEPSIPSADAPTTKEVAAWAIGYDLQHQAELAQAAVDAVTVVLLVLCI
jgi:hypothetical protein